MELFCRLCFLVFGSHSKTSKDADRTRSQVLHAQLSQRINVRSRATHYTSRPQAWQHVTQRKHGAENSRLRPGDQSGIRRREKNVRLLGPNYGPRDIFGPQSRFNRPAA